MFKPSVLQLYNQIHWNFLLKKWEKLLHCKSFTHFFNKKYWNIWDINIWNFNDTLTNNVVSFEQPGPDVLVFALKKVGRSVGWLFLGLTARWDSISVYIGPSPREREKEERKDRGE